MKGTAGSCLSFLIKQCLQIFTTQETSKSNIQQKNKNHQQKKMHSYNNIYRIVCLTLGKQIESASLRLMK